MSLNNSLGMEDFATNVLVSPQIDDLNTPKFVAMKSPQTDKLKFLQ